MPIIFIMLLYTYHLILNYVYTEKIEGKAEHLVPPKKVRYLKYNLHYNEENFKVI